MTYTHYQLEFMVADDLSALATDAGMSFSDFENAVTYALITVVGADDATLVTDSNLLAVLNWATIFALRKLQNYWITAVDYTAGPIEEKLSQVSRLLNSMTASSGANLGPVVFTDINFTFDDFTASSGIANWPINWAEIDYDQPW